MDLTLTLALPYTLKDGDRLGLLETDERDELERKTVARLDALSDRERTDAHVNVAAREIRAAYFAGLPSLAPRVTAFLLAQAVALRYGQKMPGKEGRWWRDLQEALDEHPATVTLKSAERALWLVNVWQHESVRDGLAPGLQRWKAILDDAIDRLAAALKEPAPVAAGG